MPGFAVGAIAAGVIGAAGSVASAEINSGTTQRADNQAYNEEQQSLSNATTLEAPFINNGTVAENQLANLDGLNGAAAGQQAMASFEANPAYAYQEQQGLSAIDNGAASKGMLSGGNTIRAEQTLGSNLADQSFSQYYSQLAGLAQGGLSGAQSLAGTGSSTAANEAQTATSGAAEQNQITNQGISGTTTAFDNALNNLGYGAVGTQSSQIAGPSTGNGIIQGNSSSSGGGFLNNLFGTGGSGSTTFSSNAMTDGPDSLTGAQ